MQWSSKALTPTVFTGKCSLQKEIRIRPPAPVMRVRTGSTGCPLGAAQWDMVHAKYLSMQMYNFDQVITCLVCFNWYAYSQL